MTKTAVAEPPADLSDTTANPDEGGKAYKITEHRYGRAVVTLLGKDIATKENGTFTRKFFNVEKIYKDAADKWQSTSYFEAGELADLQLAIDDARRAMHTK